MALSMKVIDENEFCRLGEYGGWWVIEDKTLLKYPVEYSSETKTLINIYMEFVILDNKAIPVRTYYPKDQFRLDDVKEQFKRLTEKRRKEYERFKKRFG